MTEMIHVTVKLVDGQQRQGMLPLESGADLASWLNHAHEPFVHLWSPDGGSKPVAVSVRHIVTVDER